MIGEVTAALVFFCATDVVEALIGTVTAAFVLLLAVKVELTVIFVTGLKVISWTTQSLANAVPEVA